jgi:elongator complex protein 3
MVGLTLETRPDYITEKEVARFRQLGCTRVELGAQSIFDHILDLNRRGHRTRETINATRLLKDSGFKVNYHIMPGLPGSDLENDTAMFRELFSNPNYQPDMLKIYPTVVIRNSELFDIWKAGGYVPMADSQLEAFVLKIKNEIIPPYVRLNRLVRDVPTTSIEAGPKITNLRQIIANRSHCRCVRCREVKGNYNKKEKIILDRIDYDASGGKEIFLQFVSTGKKKLFALLRLRITENSSLPIMKNAVIIREVHTYGKLTGIDKADKNSPQHIGLGKKLIREAEKIAEKEFGRNKVVIISGVGVRQYYRKLGYRLKDTYMVKYI